MGIDERPTPKEEIIQGVNMNRVNGPRREIEAGIEPLPDGSPRDEPAARLPQAVEDKFVVR